MGCGSHKGLCANCRKLKQHGLSVLSSLGEVSSEESARFCGKHQPGEEPRKLGLCVTSPLGEALDGSGG